MANTSPGTLYVVATPIGHLQDISLRAIELLRQVDLIAAEDTRHSRILLNHWQITTPMMALHSHNEVGSSAQLIKRLHEGNNIALISDAGTPLVSDPGFTLVRQAQNEGIPVSPIPGACALIAALSVAGLPSDQFTYIGFLPPKKTARITRMKSFSHEPRTLICYEAPHRLLAAIEDCIEVFGATRNAVIARELTKTFETIHRGSLEELHQSFIQNPQQQRGEIVMLITGFEEPKNQIINPDAERILTLLLQELPVNQAVKEESPGSIGQGAR
jgi:16S rRNA (cytidine1402-2'-O)-methyltransferase